MSYKALIIDDDVFNLEVLARLLDREGIDYVAIQDPLQITRALETPGGFNLVFLDLEMPKVDGYAALKQIRARFGDSVPVIACTVHLNEIENAHEQGFHSFLEKPLKVGLFPKLLHRILNGERVWID
jgi:CheY-like chemotaxis protein